MRKFTENRHIQLREMRVDGTGDNLSIERSESEKKIVKLKQIYNELRNFTENSYIQLCEMQVDGTGDNLCIERSESK